jgi:hypothetical protein
MAPLVLPQLDAMPVFPGLAYEARLEPNFIAMDDKKSIANIFCFGEITYRNSGTVYHDLTGLFPFVSFDGSVCFFVFYHYQLNTILITPIAEFDNMRVLINAYKTHLRLFR